MDYSAIDGGSLRRRCFYYQSALIGLLLLTMVPLILLSSLGLEDYANFQYISRSLMLNVREIEYMKVLIILSLTFAVATLLFLSCYVFYIVMYPSVKLLTASSIILSIFLITLIINGGLLLKYSNYCNVWVTEIGQEWNRNLNTGTPESTQLIKVLSYRARCPSWDFNNCQFRLRSLCSHRTLGFLDIIFGALPLLLMLLTTILFCCNFV